jgi:hypothetical protein
MLRSTRRMSSAEAVFGLRRWAVGVCMRRFRCDVVTAEEVFSQVVVEAVELDAGGEVIADAASFIFVRSRLVWLALCRERFLDVDANRRSDARRVECDWCQVVLRDRCQVDRAEWAVEGALLAFDEARHLGPVQRAVFEAAVRIAAEGRFERAEHYGESLYTRLAQDASELLGRRVSPESAGKSLQVVQRRMRRCAWGIVSDVGA